MLVEIILFGVTALLTYVLYKLATIDRLYFEKRNIKYRNQSSALQIFLRVLFSQYTAIELAELGYNAFRDELWVKYLI